MPALVFLDDVAPYRKANGSIHPAGIHQSLTSAARAMAELSELCGLDYHHLAVADLDRDAIGGASVLVLFTIGDTPYSLDQQALISERTANGELSLFGLHSATDAATSWPGYRDLLGARFSSHPVTGTLPLALLDASHPCLAGLPDPWLVEEELYLFDELSPDARVLLGVPREALDPDQRARLADAGPHAVVSDRAGRSVLPLCWCIERGGLRSFYSALGHFVSAYEDPRYLEHLLGALRWLLER